MSSNNETNSGNSSVQDFLRRRQAMTNPRAASSPRTFQMPPGMGYGREKSGEPATLEALTNGVLHDGDHGAVYHIPTRHEGDHRHGGRLLSDWLTQDLAGAALFSNDERLANIDPRRCLFLDTETTGLGSMSIAFLVGVGYFTAAGFEVRQFFLRDPSDEPAMLHELRAMLSNFDALVTFNGRGFDVPLLESRYTLNRQRLSFAAWANLDLLYPARKLWKRRLESCRLANLELEILGVERTGEDVPGSMIPYMYQEYVVTKDARDMQRVIYHNLIDILSMVTLGAQLCETFAQPHHKRLPGEDWLSLARWYERLNRDREAEAAYRAALDAARLDSEMVAVMEWFAEFLKKRDRHAEAVPLWETWAMLQPKMIPPRLELAKYHEWTTKDRDQAEAWALDALNAIQKWGTSAYKDATISEIEHRLARLRKKNHD